MPPAASQLACLLIASHSILFPIINLKLEELIDNEFGWGRILVNNDFINNYIWEELFKPLFTDEYIDEYLSFIEQTLEINKSANYKKGDE